MMSALRMIAVSVIVLKLLQSGTCFAQPNPWPGDYRHVHKPQILAVTTGDFKTAVAEARTILADFPDDAESLFFLGIAYANLGDPQEANETIRNALAAGVVPERFLIGSDDWTEILRTGPDFDWLRRQCGSSILTGPMLGSVTDSTAQVWIRAAKSGTVRLRYNERSADNAEQKTETLQVTGANDLTDVFTLRDLQTDTSYDYAIDFDDDVDGVGFEAIARTGSFRTAGPANEPTCFSIAFGGGAAYLPHKERMWTTIEGHRPDMLLLLGDNVYIDDPQNPTYQRYLYYRRQCQTDFRRLTASIPVYSIWDDHDFGDNDCHGGPLVDDPPWKQPVWRIFQQNWVNPAYGGGEPAPGCWYEFSRGDVQFIMLDGRYYRDPKPMDGATPSMLGPVQKEWLKRTLSQSTARIKVLCSPVPWIGGNADKWTGFSEERDEIFTFIESNAIGGVMLLSADRHRSDLLVLRRPNGRRYFEFMSSKLTNHHTHRLATEQDGALYSYNEKCSFGLVEFDTTNSVPAVQYRVITIDGEEKFRFETLVEN